MIAYTLTQNITKLALASPRSRLWPSNTRGRLRAALASVATEPHHLLRYESTRGGAFADGSSAAAKSRTAQNQGAISHNSKMTTVWRQRARVLRALVYERGSAYTHCASGARAQYKV